MWAVTAVHHAVGPPWVRMAPLQTGAILIQSCSNSLPTHTCGSVLSSHSLLLPPPLAPSVVNMVKASAKAKAKVAVQKVAPPKENKSELVSNMACGFRNLMKYRQSEACKSAAWP